MQTSSQLSFALDTPSAIRTPSDTITEPLFWFREMRLLSALSADNDHLIRVVRFRRGLNVVWSPPSEIGASNNQRAAGHASGKTTLCRLLRGLLGEEHLGTQEIVDSIRSAFPDGWVVASLRVNGRDWCVGRPFTSLRRPRAVSDIDLDRFLSDDKLPNRYGEYLAALTEASKSIVPLDSLPGLPEIKPWHFFPWFTRDQDVQYMKLYEWRDNSISESETPFLNQEQKGLVLRAILSIGSEEESKLLEQRKDLAQRRDMATAQRQYCARIVKEDAARISASCNLDTAGQMLDPLFAAKMADALEHERREILRQCSLDEESSRLRDEISRVGDELANASQQLKAAAVVYQRERKVYVEMSRKEGKKPERSEIEEAVKALAAESPDNQFCCAPIDLALQDNCPLARKYHVGNDEEFNRKLAAISRDDKSLTAQFQKTKELQQIFVKWQDKVKTLTDAKAAAETALDNRQTFLRGSFLEQAEKKAGLRALVRRFSEETAELDKAERECRGIESDADSISDKLKASRDKAKAEMSEMKAVYDEVIKYLLGTDLGGACEMTDGQIQARCLYHGNAYTSAALNAVSVVGFDFAAMVLSCQGESRHPRFLLHDGPRVADLSASIYRRYFEFIRHLESLAGKREPNFQYIVTTTEAPPPELRQAPLLVCMLDSSIPDGTGRLFKRNLS